jgi:hypothetical protein
MGIPLRHVLLQVLLQASERGMKLSISTYKEIRGLSSDHRHPRNFEASEWNLGLIRAFAQTRSGTGPIGGS